MPKLDLNEFSAGDLRLMYANAQEQLEAVKGLLAEEPKPVNLMIGGRATGKTTRLLHGLLYENLAHQVRVTQIRKALGMAQPRPVEHKLQHASDQVVGRIYDGNAELNSVGRALPDHSPLYSAPQIAAAAIDKLYPPQMVDFDAAVVRSPGPSRAERTKPQINPIAMSFVPTDWRMIEKHTHYVLLRGNEVVATLAGPNAETNAATLALVLSGITHDADPQSAEVPNG